MHKHFKNRKGYLADAWLVLVLALVYGSSLVGVQLWLGPKIARNKLDESLRQVPSLVRGAESGRAVQVDSRRIFAALNAQGKVTGWVVPASGQGFADRIELLVGVDKNIETIQGIYILDQKETPGLGNKITEENWRNQFRGRSASRPLKVIKEGTPEPDEAMALTGATISSDSVAQIVNDAVAGLKAQKEALADAARTAEADGTG